MGGPPDPFWPTRRALEPLPAFREGLPTPPGPPEGPLDPSQTSDRALRLLSDFQEGLPNRICSAVGTCDPSRTSGRASPTPRRPPGEPLDPSRTSGMASQTLPDLGVASRSLSDPRKSLVTPSGSPQELPKPTQTSRWDSRAHPKLCEGLPNPSRTSGRDSIPLTDLRMGLSTSLRLPGVPPNPSRTSAKSFQQLQDHWEGLPDLREDLQTTPGLPLEPPDPSQTSEKASRPLRTHKGLMTPLRPSGGSPRPPRGPHDPFRPTRRASLPLAFLWEGLLTLSGPLKGPPDPSRIFGRACRFLPALRERL